MDGAANASASGCLIVSSVNKYIFKDGLCAYVVMPCTCFKLVGTEGENTQVLSGKFGTLSCTLCYMCLTTHLFKEQLPH